jgi:hypothetical protein
MGCSPYFAVTGTHLLLPLNITEATYLLLPPTTVLSTTDLIATHAVALQKRRSHLTNLRSKVMSARLQAAVRFEREHAATIRDFDFQKGDLVLVCNTAIKKSLNQKMSPRYLGPLIIISRNKGGAYIICELNRSVFDRPIAAFRVIPYFVQRSLPLPVSWTYPLTASANSRSPRPPTQKPTRLPLQTSRTKTPQCPPTHLVTRTMTVSYCEIVSQ